MKNVEKSKSSFQLISINLRKSHFEIAYPNQPLNNFKIGIRIDKKRDGLENENLECALTTNLTVSEREHFKLSVTMVGQFKIEGNNDFDVDTFLNINAPSIIYPYIRQHIRTLSLESGMTKPIILPVINFVALNQKKED